MRSACSSAASTSARACSPPRRAARSACRSARARPSSASAAASRSAERLALFGQGSLGLTAPGAAGAGLLEEVSALRSSSFALGLAGRDLLTAHDRLTVAVAQPLRVDAGAAVLDRPVGRSFDGQILRRTERVDLAPEGREIDLELGYRVALGARRELGLSWLTQLEPGHREGAAAAHAVAIRLRTAF